MRGAAGRSPEAEFVEGAVRLARDQVARRANETVIHNVGRDRARGARFARVPMGAEPCAFCTMLASRGFVYHTEETAGEFDHFHGSCRCKVVPGFPTMERYVKNGVKVSRGLDPGVEGYDPDRYYDMYEHPEEYAPTGNASGSRAPRRDAGAAAGTRTVQPGKNGADGTIKRMGATRSQADLEFGDGREQINATTHGVQGADYGRLHKGEGEFLQIKSTLRPGKHDDGAPYTDAEQRMAADVEQHGAGGSPFSSSDLAWTRKGFGRHVKKHGAEFGLDPSEKAGRDRYARIANDVIDNCDVLAYGDWAGQEGCLCLFYFKGDTVVLVNASTKTIVSVMKFERGRNARLTDIWDSVHKRPE